MYDHGSDYDQAANTENVATPIESPSGRRPNEFPLEKGNPELGVYA